MIAEKNIPALRFKGFTEAWEQRKLGDVATEFIAGGDIDVKNIKEKGAYPVCANALTENGIVGYYPDFYRITGPAVTITGRGDIGHAVARRYDFTPVVRLLSVKSAIDVDFLAEAINLAKIAFESTGVPQLTVPQASNIIISLSLSNKECVTIGSLFQKIDNHITLHQRKLDLYKNTKKSLLEKMFPKDGEDRPSFRFKGFTEAWEQRKLGTEVSFKRGLTYSPNDIVKSGVRVLRSSNINEGTFVCSDDEDVFVQSKAINIEYVKNGDILITAANGSVRLVGKHALIHDIKENTMVHGGFMLLATNTKVPNFINASLSSSWYRKFIDIYVAGGNGSIGNLNQNDLASQFVLFPNIKEQEKIGRLFEQVDTLITLHQRKLELLKNMKKALLEKMFV